MIENFGETFMLASTPAATRPEIRFAMVADLFRSGWLLHDRRDAGTTLLLREWGARDDLVQVRW
ncbi:hypothetical protein ACPOL_1724 [Acidisarcina polymorpha]|uniref:Uncharacterized protein n=1 Tax=Acidisarcina polymorpha TaxID=2211140 RepID=A0A2Z5FXF1_9BACT|nr:hypothetical protein ACPOL_1724 [Acidisarcina polymorpha]